MIINNVVIYIITNFPKLQNFKFQLSVFDEPMKSNPTGFSILVKKNS
jgi:hypothetical protein